MESIWELETQLPRFPTLDSDASTDVLVIGGGLAGLLCAYDLRREGLDCLLIERDRIGQ